MRFCSCVHWIINETLICVTFFFTNSYWKTLGWWLAKKERCYRHIGCFSDYKPFNNLNILGKKYLPDSPAKIKPRFYLFTQQNISVDEELFPYNRIAISSSGFDSRRMTVVIIHGFSATSHDYRLTDLRKAFLEKVHVLYTMILIASKCKISLIITERSWFRDFKN